MYEGLTVIDADAHKIENPLIMLDYLQPKFRDRLGLVIDSLGDQRAKLVDINPVTGEKEFIRMFPQPQGMGKGGFRNLHPDTTLGAIFNRIRLEHMDREGNVANYDREHLGLLLGGNALSLYGDRLRNSLPSNLEEKVPTAVG